MSRHNDEKKDDSFACNDATGNTNANADTNACCDAPEWDCLLQPDMSGEYSQAKHGKDFFSAINGSIKDLIAVSALYE